MFPGGKELGGAPANFAYHAGRLGARSAVVSAVGRDPLGDEIVARLEGAKLSHRYVARDPEHPTGTVTVALDSLGVPSYTIHQGVAWDHIPWSDDLEALAKTANAVGFGSLCQRSPVSRQAVRRFLEHMPEASLRVCDINLRQSFFDRETIEESFRLANVLKLNDEELPVICGLLGIEASVAELASKFAFKLVALTRGSRGSLMLTPEESSEHEGYAAEVVDTVGAGDAFTAAMVVGLLEGMPLVAINDLANRVGSFVCSRKGAMPDMGTFAAAIGESRCR